MAASNTLVRQLERIRLTSNLVGFGYGVVYAILVFPGGATDLLRTTLTWAFLTYAIVLPVGFALLALVVRPVDQVLAATARGDEVSPAALEHAQRRLLNLPALEFVQVLGLWIIPSWSYLLVFPWDSDHRRSVVTHIMVTAVIIAATVAVNVFYRVEEMTQKKAIPLLFPDGRLSALG